MKTSLLPVLLVIVCGSFLISQPLVGLARDESGCFTCHRYPGLVRPEKNHIKALHIDEEAFLKSPHGKLSCKQCHPDIVKVPHTGQNTVQCITTQCHASDKERAIVAKFPLKTLHEKEQYVMVSLQDDSSCGVCHGLYPHSQNPMVRALLNMHTGFMTCELCHLKRTDLGKVSYQWKGPERAVFTGNHFGFRYDPKTGVVRTKENAVWRLAVSVDQAGGKQMVTHTQDTQDATRFLLEEKKMDKADRKRQLNYFHRDVARKEASAACKECHSHNGILNFRKLGFDEATSDYLMNLNLAGLVAKYKVFYFPDLFGH